MPASGRSARARRPARSRRPSRGRASAPRPGTSCTAAGSVASTVSSVPGGASAAARASRITGAGQRRPRASTVVTGRRPPTPDARRRRRRAARRGTARRPAAVVPRGRARRMFPCVSAPMAASTWLGSSALDVHADPEPTAKPRASSAVRSASPSTYRHENVTTWGRRSTRVPDHVDVGDLGGDPRADACRRAGAASASSCARVDDRHLERDGGREGGGHADAAGEPAVLVLRPVGGAADAGPGHEHTEPARAAPVARVRREQVPGVADVDVPEARAGVDQQRDTGGPRGLVHGGDGLQRAHLAVRVLQRGEGHARAGEGGRRTPRRPPGRPGRPRRSRGPRRSRPRAAPPRARPR